uniref:ATP-binding cassette domain-containing protein n=1 Tax=Lachnoclostridium phocaeense TaxID=1871021 RepID=UPI0026DCCAF6|nr:ATP-binding cassette domain-containing protein [Lachnoclostridium phocaeense]
MNNEKILELQNVSYWYNSSKRILDNINLNFCTGKIYAITGASGSGKTTLMSLLGGLDMPREGSILYRGSNINKIGYEKYRKECVSFVFQNYNLINYMTSLENVMLTAKSSPLPFLQEVGISEDEAKRNVLKLSGGQQQRVAIARAIAAETPIILADEPTGNLDEKTSNEIVHLLCEQAHKKSKCVIVVTHSNSIAATADQTYEIIDGAIKSVE